MIKAYVGLFGQGKTLSMVADAIPQLLAGRKVFTNVPFRAWYETRPSTWDRLRGKKPVGDWIYPIYLYAKDFEKALKSQTDALFLVDEASIWFSSYMWSNLSPDYIIRFAQARKFGLDIYYTSQLFKHTVKRLRDLTNEVVECRYRSPFPLFPRVITNTGFNPEKYDFQFFNKEQEERFVMERKTIGGQKLKHLFECYDTFFTIDYSAVMTGSKDLKADPNAKSTPPDLSQFTNL